MASGADAGEDLKALFVSWVTAWRDDSMRRGTQAQYTYSRCLRSLRAYPLPITSVGLTTQLQGVGPATIKKLRKKLLDHCKKEGRPVPTTPGVATPDAATNHAKKPGLATSSSGGGGDGAATGTGTGTGGAAKRKPRKKKAYVPGERTGGYAVLLALLKYSNTPGYKEYMTKSELTNLAQQYCNESFTEPKPGSRYRYTAWSSVSKLIAEQLVLKCSNPAKYSLTDAGLELAKKLHRTSSTPSVGGGGVAPASATVAAGTASDSAVPMAADDLYAAGSLAGVRGTGKRRRIGSTAEPMGARKRPHSEASASGAGSGPTGRSSSSSVSGEGAGGGAGSGRGSGGSTSASSAGPPSIVAHSAWLPGAARLGAGVLAPVAQRPGFSRSSSSGVGHDGRATSATADGLCENCEAALAVVQCHDCNERYCQHCCNFTHQARRKLSHRRTLLPPPAADPPDEPVVDLSTPQHGPAAEAGYASDSSLDSSPPLVSLAERLGWSTVVDSAAAPNHPRRRKGSTNQSARQGAARRSPRLSMQSPTVLEHDHQLSEAELDAMTSPWPSADSARVTPCAVERPPSWEPTDGEGAEQLPLWTPKAAAAASGAATTPVDHYRHFVLQPGAYEVLLVIDTMEETGNRKRQRRGDLQAALLGKGVACDSRSLPLGDFLWVARELSADPDAPRRELVLDYVVERKRLDDLASSVMDGRFADQKFRLRDMGIRRPICIIEKHGSYDTQRLRPDHLKQLVVDTQAQDGFFIKETASIFGTVDYLVLLTEQIKRELRGKALKSAPFAVFRKLPPDEDEDAKGRRLLSTFHDFVFHSAKTKDLSTSEMLVKQLIQITRLTKAKALAVVEQFPTVGSLLDAFAGDLCEAERTALLGDVRANKQKMGQALGKTLAALYA